MPLNIARLQAIRDRPNQNLPPRPHQAAGSLTGAEELAAAANATLIALVEHKTCPVCKGGGWIDKHSLECPIPELQKAVKKIRFFSTDKLMVEQNLVVRKDERGIVSVYGIPWDRWIFLKPTQRIDVISRKHQHPRATRIVCRFCKDKTYVVTPLRKGQRIDTCFECWSIHSRGLEGAIIARKEAVAKARWSKSQVKLRVIHRVLAAEYVRKARTLKRIVADLRQASTDDPTRTV